MLKSCTYLFGFYLLMQILPGMSDILSTLPSVNPRVQQPCLQFTYWSVVFMEQTVQGSQVLTDNSSSTHVKCVYYTHFTRALRASEFHMRTIVRIELDLIISFLSLFGFAQFCSI